MVECTDDGAERKKLNGGAEKRGTRKDKIFDRKRKVLAI